MKLANLLSTVLLAIPLSLFAAEPAGKTHTGQVPEGLSKSDWQNIRAAYDAGRHAFHWNGGEWQARNPGQQWTMKFDGRGFIAEPRDGGWEWGLELKSYGFGGAERTVGRVPAVQAGGQRLSYHWDAAVQEWWVNDARGLEHGFIVKARPDGPAGAPLQFDLAVRGTLRPQVDADGLGVAFRDATGATVLNYSGLKVWDADGKTVPSHFAAIDARHPALVTLLVDERGARYPLTIDPIAQQAYLKPAAVGTTQAGDQFGYSVAISGNTVVVGAPYEDSATTGVNSAPNEGAGDAGAAYVFVRNGTTWSQQAYLKPDSVGSTQAGDQFGRSVAISGNTVVVGAPYEDGSTTGVNGTPNESATDAGAAYVFLRTTGVWAQQAYLKPAAVGATQAADWFGYSVTISGNTVVVGAPGEDSSTTGVNTTPDENSPYSGAACVFVRSGTNWTQQGYLKHTRANFQESFGASVAVSGDTVVVGAPTESSRTTGVNSTPAFDIHARHSGAAYVFVRSGGNWSQEAYLKPAVVGTLQAYDWFGTSVAVSGDTVVVGAPQEDSSTTGVNSTPNDEEQFIENVGVDPYPLSNFNSGAAYVFARSGTAWTQQSYLKPAAVGTTQGGDNFGWSVAISTDTVIVGAYREDSSTTNVNGAPNESAANSGAAYEFVRCGTAWVQQSYLKPSAVGTTQAGDSFGVSVAVSGDTVIVGASGEAGSTTGVNGTPSEDAPIAGAACVFSNPPAVRVTFVNPPAGSVGGGKAATIYGYGFSGASSVTFGGTEATSFTVDSDTQITATTPAHSAGPVAVAVTAFAGNGSGTGLFSYSGVNNTDDSDGDGLNDAAELELAALGFNWQTAQTAQVNSFLSGTALFTESQYDANFASGRNAVINNPNAYDLYSLTQMKALNVDAELLTRDATSGQFTLSLGLQRSSDLQTFSPFPFLAPQTSIQPDGRIHFQFTDPDNAAFFRVLSGSGSAQSPFFGNAVSLSGTNQYLTVPAAAGSAVNSPFTIEAWVFVRAYASWSRLMDFGNGPGNAEIAFALTSGTSGRPRIQFYNAAGSLIGDLISPSVLPLNTWTHLAFTYDGTNGRLFIDGNLDVSGAMGAPPAATRTSNFIGRSIWGDPDADAIFDEFRIWSVARSQTQIAANLGAPLLGNNNGLQLYYRFDSASGSVAANSATATGAAGNGTLINNPTWVAGPPLPN